MSKKKYVDDGHTIYNMDGLKKGPKSEKISLSSKEKIALFCPHGRPIAVRISKTEIEKWFKRIV